MINVKYRLLLPVIAMAASLSACVYDPYYHGPAPAHPHYYPYYYPYYYDYYYYPSAQVYFQFSTGFYFYFLNNRWIKTRVLPPHIHLYPRERVTIRLDTDKPYLKHRDHVKKYRPVPEYRPQPEVLQKVLPRVDKRVPAPQKVEPKSPVLKRQPVPSQRPPVSRDQYITPDSKNEREQNQKIYQQHQKKQKDYEEEWKKREKVYRR